MMTHFRFRTVFIPAIVVVLQLAYCAQAQEYEWLKSPEYESIFVFTELKECDCITDELKETVVRTFSRSNIKATVSNSFIFKAAKDSDDSAFELVDEELIGNSKIILHIYGKCVRYGSGFIYQFDINFGVNDTKHSQALLYATPRHSVIGVDSLTGIDRVFRMLMRNAVDDYRSANQQESAAGPGRPLHFSSSK